MASARRGRGGFSHSDFFCISGQSLLSFLLKSGNEEGSSLFIVRVTSYVNDLFVEKNTKSEKCNPSPLSLRLQILTLQLGGRDCNR